MHFWAFLKRFFSCLHKCNPFHPRKKTNKETKSAKGPYFTIRYCWVIHMSSWECWGAFVWDQSGIRTIGIMQVSICLGAILILKYLDFHSGYSAPGSRIVGLYSRIYSYSGISQTNVPSKYHPQLLVLFLSPCKYYYSTVKFHCPGTPY